MKRACETHSDSKSFVRGKVNDITEGKDTEIKHRLGRFKHMKGKIKLKSEEEKKEKGYDIYCLICGKSFKEN